MRWLVYFLVSLALILIIFYPRQYVTGKKYQVGEIADKTIRVLRDLEVEDRVTTEEHRKQAEKEAQEVYDFAPQLAGEIKERLSEFFLKMKELYQPSRVQGEEAISVPASFRKEREEELVSELGVELEERELEILRRFYFDREILARSERVVDRLYQSPLVLDREILKKAQAKGIIIHNLQTGEQKVLRDFSEIKDLRQARRELSQLVKQEFAGYPSSLKKVIEKIISELLRPNLTFNKQASEQVKKEKIEAVKPVYFKLKKGEVIVRRGDRISPEQWKKLQAIQNRGQKFGGGILFLGLLIVFTLAQFFTYHFAQRNIKKFKLQFKDLVFLSLCLVVSLFILKLVVYLGGNLKEIFSLPEEVSFYYLAGIAGSAMVVRMILNSEVAVIYSLLLAGFSGLVLNFDIYPVLYHLVGCLVVADEVGVCEQRSKIFRAGVFLGLVNVIMVFGFALLQNNIQDQELLLYNSTFAFSGGIFSAILTTGLVPALESLFNYSTNIKLLELLNQEHPLLKKLSLHAPGTHQHSLLVANLAEAAAESIGANPILARVMAMYHDIGKLNKPEYFAENQREGKNPHLKIKPSMSALILINHAKEGVEMAEKYHLPREVIEGIRQHHGTSLMKFFYEKAKEVENPEVDTVEEEDFRYPGPKPQTREAGILMLADIVESASRTIQDPNPAKIKGTVDNLINRAFVDGQLDECELTLKDLHEIAKAFTKVLGAMYHSRPDYPEPVEKGASGGKKRNHGLDSESAKMQSATEPTPGKGKEAIKRLGG